MRLHSAILVGLIAVSCGGQAPTGGIDAPDDDGGSEVVIHPMQAAWDGNYVGVGERTVYGFGDVLKDVPPQVGDNGLLSIKVTPDLTASDTTRFPRHTSRATIRAALGESTPFADGTLSFGPSPAIRFDRMGDSYTGMNYSSGRSIWKWCGAVVSTVSSSDHFGDTSDQEFRRRNYEVRFLRYIGFKDQEVAAVNGWDGTYRGYAYRDSSEFGVDITSVAGDSLDVTVMSNFGEPTLRLRLGKPTGPESCVAGTQLILVPAAGDTVLAFAAVLAGDKLGVISSRYHSYVVNTITGQTGGMVPIWSVTGVADRQ